MTDNNAISSSSISVSGSGSPDNLVCTQTSGTQVNCTVRVTSSGTLLVDGSDTAGNIATQVSETNYIIDSTRPVITITAPTKSSVTTITDTTIRITDNNAIASTSISISGSATPTSLVCVQTSSTRVDCTVSITTNGDLLVDATDVVGNSALQTSEVGYFLNSLTPMIVITAPTKTSSTTITNTTIRVSDDTSVLANTVIVSGSASPTDLVCSQTSASRVDCTVRITTSGTLFVDATDADTNPAPQASETGYVIDTTAPIISVTAPTKTSSTTITNTTIRVTDNNAILSSSVVVSGSATPTHLVCSQTSGTEVNCTLTIASTGDLLVDATDVAGKPAVQASETGYRVDSVVPVIVITAPTKIATTTITDTTIRVTDDTYVASTSVRVSGSATPSSLVCVQTSDMRVDCTIRITSSGTLLVDATDIDGNPGTQVAESDYTVDATSFSITSPHANPHSNASDVIWTTTKNSSAKALYSLDTSYTSSTTEIDTSPRVSEHSVHISGLLPCVSYKYKAVSTDVVSNTVTSSDEDFTTLGCSGDAIPNSILSKVLTVTASSTASLAHESNILETDLPPDVTSTSSQIIIQIKSLESSAALSSIGRPGNLHVAAPVVFDVKAIVNSDTVLDSFDYPIIITYHYSDAGISGIDESTLVLYHYHSGTWEPLDHCVIDESANTITCSTPNFSVFALFGNQSAVVAQTTQHSSSRSSGGNSVPSRVTNLIDMGKVPAAQKLITEWPQLFLSSTTTSTTSSSEYFLRIFTRNLTKGDYGADVKELQKFLNTNGFIVSATGTGSKGNEGTLFGPATLAALSRFQFINNIQPAFGYFGPLTRTLVLSLLGSGTPTAKPVENHVATSTLFMFTRDLQVGMQGDDVRKLQEFLISRATGLAAKELAAKGASGIFGSFTENALREFQKARSVSPTGYFGPKTRAVVGK